MTVMVTGASGFVGLNLLNGLLADGHRVVGYAASPIPRDVREKFAVLPGILIEVSGDIRDQTTLGRLMQEHGVRRVAHLAAITAGEERERRGAQEIIAVNLGGLAAVLAAAAEAGVERFLAAGSIAVFGGEGEDGSLIDEDFPHHPKTLYAITKSAGEAMLARLAGLSGVDWVMARLGRVFGPYEYETGVRDTLSQIYQVTRAAIDGESVAFARPCVKNWSYAPDAATAMQTLLLAPTLQHRIYNLGAPHAWSLSAWCARLAERFTGFRFRVGAAECVDKGGCRIIDLGGPRDGGLLSWQRFATEFAPLRSHGLDGSFDAYLRFLRLDKEGVT